MIFCCLRQSSLQRRDNEKMKKKKKSQLISDKIIYIVVGRIGGKQMAPRHNFKYK